MGAIPILGLAVGAALTGAGVAAASRRWATAVASSDRWPTAAVALASAAAAAVGPGRPTGLAVADAAWRAAVGVGFVVAATRARRWAWLAAGAALAVSAPPAPVATAAAFGSLGLALGWSATRRPGRVAGALVGAGLAQAALRLSWPDVTGATAGVAAVAAGVLAVSGWRQASRRSRSRASAVLLGVVGGVGAVLTAWGVAVIDARAQFAQAVDAARAGLAGVAAGELDGAAAHLEEAARAFGRAGRSLDAWWARPAQAVPVVGPNARALAATSRTGRDLADVAGRAAAALGDPALAMRDGRVDPDAVDGLVEPLEESLRHVVSSRRTLAGVSSVWLAAPVRDRLAGLDARLARADEQGAGLVRAARALPAMLGAGGPRRYFVALQTPSELRAAGGFIGNWAELTVTDGRLELTRLGRVSELNPPPGEAFSLSGLEEYLARYDRFGPRRYFQNATLSPDFPSAARVMAQLYPQAGGAPVDGVIGVDPIALGALLSVTGPVEVPAWPEPIGADNVERVLLHDQYLRLSGSSREDFLGDVTRATFDALVTRGVHDWARAIAAMAPAAAGRHLMVWALRPDEQAAVRAAGLDGGVAPLRGDYVQVVTQNGGENKIDWYLRRSITYRVTFDPVTGTATARVEIALSNEAPPGGEPPIVIGGAGSPYPAGVNRLWLSLYTPLGFDGATLDGRPLLMQSERELGRNVYGQFLSIPPRSQIRVVVRLVGTLRPGPYRLDVGRQPTVTPDRLRVFVRVPGGRTLARYEGILTRNLVVGTARNP